MTKIDTAALRALMEKATKGPFYTTGQPWFSSGSGVLAGSPDPHAGYMIADCEQWEGERKEYAENDGYVKIAGGDDDAAMIAAALNALPALLDAYEERERMRVALESYSCECAYDHCEVTNGAPNDDDVSCGRRAREAINGGNAAPATNRENS